MTAKVIREWLAQIGLKTLFIEPGSPWENGYCESFLRQAQGRAAQRRKLLQPEGGSDRHREMTQAPQRETAAFVAWILAASISRSGLDTAPRNGRRDAVISHSAWFKNSVRLPNTFGFQLYRRLLPIGSGHRGQLCRSHRQNIQARLLARQSVPRS
jgi:hypothetical protein